MNNAIAKWCLLGVLAGACASAQATLPPPTPKAVEAAAAKKAAADAQAQRDKDALLASMDGVSKRWRANAAKQGWKAYPPVAVLAPVAGVSAGTPASPAVAKPAGGASAPGATPAPSSSSSSPAPAPAPPASPAVRPAPSAAPAPPKRGG